MQLDFINKFKNEYLPFKVPSVLNIKIKRHHNTNTIHEELFYNKVKKTIIEFRKAEELNKSIQGDEEFDYDEDKEVIFNKHEEEVLRR